MAKNKIRRSCADHECRCVYCACGAMLGAAVGLKLPETYRGFGSDVITEFGFRLPPGDLALGIVREDCFDDLIVKAPDNAVAGLALMWVIGRFGTCTLDVPEASA